MRETIYNKNNIEIWWHNTYVETFWKCDENCWNMNIRSLITRWKKFRRKDTFKQTQSKHFSTVWIICVCTYLVRLIATHLGMVSVATYWWFKTETIKEKVIIKIKLHVVIDSGSFLIDACVRHQHFLFSCGWVEMMVLLT